MLTIKRIRSEHGELCRKCINALFDTQLTQEDVVYTIYPSECFHCHKVKPLVEDLRPSGRMKTLLK